jgi:hypothetical protein
MKTKQDSSMPNNLSKNGCLEKIRSVVQQIMLSRTDLAVLIYGSSRM